MSFFADAIKTMRILLRAVGDGESMSVWRQPLRVLPPRHYRPPPFDRKRFLSTRLKS